MCLSLPAFPVQLGLTLSPARPGCFSLGGTLVLLSLANSFLLGPRVAPPAASTEAGPPCSPVGPCRFDHSTLLQPTGPSSRPGPRMSFGLPEHRGPVSLSGPARPGLTVQHLTAIRRKLAGGRAFATSIWLHCVHSSDTPASRRTSICLPCLTSLSSIQTAPSFQWALCIRQCHLQSFRQRITLPH